jgi:hypothetical protein
MNGGAIDTTNAALSILPVPEILTHSPPQDTACTGSIKTLTITVKSDENVLSFQWFRNSVLIPGATARVLNLNPVTSNMAGVYSCRVNGCSEIVSNPTVLTVLEPTAITAQPTSIDACANTPGSLRVIATGNNLAYQWKKNGLDIPNATSSTLAFASLQASDAGTYSCVVTGFCGNPVTSSNATITITPSPVVTLAFSNDTTLCAGKPFKITASGTGGTITSFIWKRNGTTLQVTDSVLNIPSLANTDQGVYSVQVMNSCNQVSSEKTINVAVRELPMIVLQPRDTAAIEGTLATLRVIANGTTLRYQWRKSKVNRPGDTNAVLSIPNAVLADSGSYDCVISNACETITSGAATLTIEKAMKGPRLTLSQSSIDFGCVDKGTNQDKTIQSIIKNEGESDLVVTAMNMAGSQASQFSIIGPTTFTLTPGQAQNITVKFTAGDILTNTADITIKSNSTTGDRVLALIGKSCFERIDTTEFSFGKLATGVMSKDTVIRICNTGSKDVSITGLTIIGSDKFSINSAPNSPFTIFISDCKNINVSFNADQSGTYTAGLLVTTTGGTYTIPLKVEITTSVEEEDIATLQIMPNPTQQQFRLQGLRIARIESISIYSMMGKMVQNTFGPFDDSIEFSLNGLHAGLYVVRLQSEDGRIFTRHIMKQD